MHQLILEILDAYGNRIRLVDQIIDGSHELIETSRLQRKKMDGRLRENLAHAESFRKKDFDRMMSRLRSHHDAKEEELKSMLRIFIAEHQNMVNELRSLLTGGDNDGHQGEHERLGAFRKRFEQIKKEQTEREKEVKRVLTSYQYEQDYFSEVMTSLLDKGLDIRLIEVKSAVHDLFPKAGDYEHQRTQNSK